MDINEYIQLSNEYDEQNRFEANTSELNQFVTVWLKSRRPELFKELEHSFKDKESQLYAYRECQSHHIDFNF